MVRVGCDTTLVALPAWFNGQILAPVETWVIMMATGRTRETLPGTELWVGARLDARTEADLALQDWEPSEQGPPRSPPLPLGNERATQSALGVARIHAPPSRVTTASRSAAASLSYGSR